jgi:hypothetical protein
MGRSLNVVKSDGTVAFFDISRLSILLVLNSLALVAALAVNDFFKELLNRYVKKDGLLAYFIYAVIAITAVLLVAYVACKWDDRLVDYINVSPLG